MQSFYDRERQTRNVEQTRYLASSKLLICKLWTVTSYCLMRMHYPLIRCCFPMNKYTSSSILVSLYARTNRLRNSNACSCLFLKVYYAMFAFDTIHGTIFDENYVRRNDSRMFALQQRERVFSQNTLQLHLAILRNLWNFLIETFTLPHRKSLLARADYNICRRCNIWTRGQKVENAGIFLKITLNRGSTTFTPIVNFERFLSSQNTNFKIFNDKNSFDDEISLLISNV